jgi:hypothetical protein
VASRLGKSELRLGPALEIFPLFLRHLIQDIQIITDRASNDRTRYAVPQNHVKLDQRIRGPPNGSGGGGRRSRRGIWAW